jgi:hypothetical protein
MCFAFCWLTSPSHTSIIMAERSISHDPRAKKIMEGFQLYLVDLYFFSSFFSALFMYNACGFFSDIVHCIWCMKDIIWTWEMQIVVKYYGNLVTGILFFAFSNCIHYINHNHLFVFHTHFSPIPLHFMWLSITLCTAQLHILQCNGMHFLHFITQVQRYVWERKRRFVS